MRIPSAEKGKAVAAAGPSRICQLRERYNSRPIEARWRDPADMRTNLQVPFAEKDQAKALGARWDPAKRVWYVQNASDLSAFSRWLPQDATAAATPPASHRKAPAAFPTVTGPRYFELHCECLPWVGCAVCRAKVEAANWNTPD